MNNILKLKFSQAEKTDSVLGLALDGSKLDGVVLQAHERLAAIAAKFFRRR
jgi:hypothetical protein